MYDTLIEMLSNHIMELDKRLYWVMDENTTQSNQSNKATNINNNHNNDNSNDQSLSMYGTNNKSSKDEESWTNDLKISIQEYFGKSFHDRLINGGKVVAAGILAYVMYRKYRHRQHYQ